MPMTRGMNWTAWNSLREKAETSRPRATPTKASTSATRTTQAQLPARLTPRPQAHTATRRRDCPRDSRVKAVA